MVATLPECRPKRRTVPSKRKWLACGSVPLGGHDRLELFVRVLASGRTREQAFIKTFPGRGKPMMLRALYRTLEA